MNTNQEELLCSKCRRLVPYSIKTRHRLRVVNGREYEYSERYGECDVCHQEIWTPGIDDENEKRFNLQVRRCNGLITVDEINEILTKYDIEKRPLSHLLGFGEHTISRYLEWQLPNREYSDLLLSLLHNPSEMKKRLEEGKDRITSVAYKKVSNKLAQISKYEQCESRLELAALYIANSEYDITNLSLQKLLYFVKAFSLGVFEGDPVFEGECQAWAYGPVFPGIYSKYKEYGNYLIPKLDLPEDFFERFSSENKAVIDYVLANLGRLNGKVLMDITHKESPWNDARSGLLPYESSANIISDSSIKEYYHGINDIYDLKQRVGVNKYIDSLFYEG
jgi:uncharacterized phage-associated protein